MGVLESVTIPTTDIPRVGQSEMNGENIGLRPHSLRITSPLNILAVLSYNCQDTALIITAIVPTVQTIFIFIGKFMSKKLGSSQKRREICLGSGQVRKRLSYGEDTKISKSSQVKLFEYTQQVS